MHPFFGNSADNDARMQTSPVNGLKLCVRIAGKTVEKNSLTGAYRPLGEHKIGTQERAELGYEKKCPA